MRDKYLRLVLLGTATLKLSACQPTKLPPDDFAAYMQDREHGFCQMQQVAGTEVQVVYQPIDLLISRELQGHIARQTQLDSLRRKYAGSTFFLLSLSRNGHEVLQPREGFSEYSSLLQTLAFQMGDYTRLITSQHDTLRPTNYYLDRTYASSGSSQLLFVFPRVPATGTWRFQLQECGLGTGNLSFPFDAQTLAAAPTLALP